MKREEIDYNKRARAGDVFRSYNNKLVVLTKIGSLRSGHGIAKLISFPSFDRWDDREIEMYPDDRVNYDGHYQLEQLVASRNLTPLGNVKDNPELLSSLSPSPVPANELEPGKEYIVNRPTAAMLHVCNGECVHCENHIWVSLEDDQEGDYHCLDEMIRDGYVFHKEVS